MQSHEESIFQLLPQQQPVMSKPAMYRSKVRALLLCCCSTAVDTLGCVGEQDEAI